MAQKQSKAGPDQYSSTNPRQPFVQFGSPKISVGNRHFDFPPQLSFPFDERFFQPEKTPSRKGNIAR
jgi:hypothetical protein